MADQIKKIEMRERGDGTYNQLLYPRTSIDMVDGLQSALDSKETPAGAQAKANQAEANAKAASVPISRTINGKALSSNISLTAADVGAVPTSRTVNGLALSSNITLNHNHVGAVNAVSTGSTADPNTTQEPYILTNHANSPGLGVYWHIHTYFYSSKTGNRAQQAISYNGAETRMFVRHNYGGSWTAWQEVTGGGGVPVLVASNTLQESFDTVRTHTNTPWLYLIGKHIPKGTGEIRITIETYKNSGTADLYVRLFPPKTNFRLIHGTSMSGYGLDWRTPLNTALTSDMVFDLPIITRNYQTDSTYRTLEAVVSVTAGTPLYVLVGSSSKSSNISWSCRNLRFYYDVIS